MTAVAASWAEKALGLVGLLGRDPPPPAALHRGHPQLADRRPAVGSERTGHGERHHEDQGAAAPELEAAAADHDAAP